MSHLQCPYCGRCYDAGVASVTPGRVPLHTTLILDRVEVCPGSGQVPQYSESDERTPGKDGGVK